MLHSLGNFDTKEQAALAYDQAARQHAAAFSQATEAHESELNRCCPVLLLLCCACACACGCG